MSVSSYIGLDDFLMYGIGGAPTISFGKVQPGSNLGQDEGFRHSDAVGGQDDIEWDMHNRRVSIKTTYKGESLISKCQRGAKGGLPSQIELWGGLVAAASLSHAHTGYVTDLEIACGGINEEVMVNYDVVCLTGVQKIATAGQVAAITATAPFLWEKGAVTIGGAALGCKSFSIKNAENITLDSDLDVKAANVQREPTEALPGDQVVSATFVVKTPPWLNFNLDTPTLPITAAIIISNGYTTKTISATGLYVKPIGAELVRGADKHTFSLDCETVHNPLVNLGAPALTIA